PRRLAVMSSYASGDRDILIDALTGPSAALAALATNAAARLLDEVALAAVLPDLPAARRRPLARACAATRPGVVERAFPRLADKDRAKLLAYAGGAFVATQLADADFADRLAPEDWSRLAGRHPVAAVA